AGLDAAKLAVRLRDLDHLSSRSSRRGHGLWHAGPAVQRVWWSLNHEPSETHMGSRWLRSRYDLSRTGCTGGHYCAVARCSDRVVHKRILAQISAAGLFGALVRRVMECVAIAFCCKE